jgi:hypothetical protein
MQIFYVFKLQFFINTIPNNQFSTIRFKTAFFVYKIAMPNTPLKSICPNLLAKSTILNKIPTLSGNGLYTPSLSSASLTMCLTVLE